MLRTQGDITGIMFKTKSLAKVLPSLHQSLPLGKRDSQRLLDTLKSSFRKHLDREHGFLPEETVATGSLSHLRRPTDDHLSEILRNPLFSMTGNAPTHTALPARDLGIDAQLAIFDKAVARGMMTTKRAQGFMVAVKDAILRSSLLSVKDGMRASGAGMRVLAWLRNSGLEKDLAFVQNKYFTAQLFGFLVAEGLEDQIWVWLKQAGEMASDHTVEGIGSATQTWNDILRALIKAKRDSDPTSANLDASYATIVRADELFKDNPRLVPHLRYVWTKLSWLSTVTAWRFSRPEEALFESFVAIDDHMDKPQPVYHAHLDLHHPNPDKVNADRAVRILSKSESGPLPLSTRLHISHNTPKEATQIMSLGLDTVNVLSRLGDVAGAGRILDVVQREIAPFILSKPFEGKVAI